MFTIAMDQAYLGPHITHLASLTDQLEQYKDLKDSLTEILLYKLECELL